MAYKKLIKASDVCQLLDKSKYPATTTINGVTFTNNGDGTITLDGTGNVYSAYNILLIGTLNETHKYLFTAATQPCSWGQTYGMTCTDNTSVGFDSGNGKIFTNEKRFALVAYVWKQNTVSNLVFKPQLFDLTEMYGAGNEPTTVEEFRQDFPEEMYDYSPYCWLTSYKRVFMTGDGNYLTTYKRNLTCKTKNLFDMNSYFNLTNSNIIINGNSILCVATGANGHIFYKIPTVIGEKYTVSNKSIVRKIPAQASNYGIFISDNGNPDSSNYLPSGLMSGQSFTFTARTEFLYVHWYITYSFYPDNPNSIEVNELQVELGDTATDYVPYGYL